MGGGEDGGVGGDCGGSSIIGTTLLFEKKCMLNFRFNIRVGSFGQSFGPPSLVLGQCPKFNRFSILQPSLSVLY